MQSMKKFGSLFLALTVAMSLFVGCASKENTKKDPKASVEPPKQVKLSWVNWGSMEDATKPAFQAMINDFEQKNSNIKIESIGFPYNNMKDQLLIMNASGTPADMAQCAPIWVAPLNDTGALASMDTVLDKAVLDDFYPSALQGTKIGGKLMSIPWNLGPLLLYYNKDLAKKAGITEPPKTWNEMIEQSKKIAKLGKDEKGNKIYGFSLATKKLFNAGYWFLPSIWQNGGEFIDEKGNIVINSPGTLEAYKEAKMLVESEVSPAGLEVKELRNLFSQGQLGFHLDVASIMAVFEKGSPKGKEFAKDYGSMRVPGAKGSEGISFSSDHHFVVFKASKNVKESAKFVDYLSGPDGMKVYIDNGTLVLPARKATENLEYYKKADDKLKPFLAAIPTIRSLPVQNSEFIKACEEIAESIQRVGLNKEDPAKVLSDLEKKLKTLYKQ